MIKRPSRPVGITILAVLEILIGIVGLLASLAIIGFFAAVSPLLLSSAIGSWVTTWGLIIGGVVLFFSIIWLATGVGFLHGRGWSWTLGMIFSIFSMLGAIGALAIGLITGGAVGLFFWGLMLYYLTRTHVKAFFGNGRLPFTPAYGMPYSLGPQSNQPQMATNNKGHSQPTAVVPPVTFPPLSQASSTTITAMSPSSSTPSSPSPSSGSKVPATCPYCHSTLPMGTKKCLTCGAVI
jgi:hypothetical protein